MGTVEAISQARQIREVFLPVRKRLKLVEAFIEDQLERALPLVRDVASYVLASGGKRLRPALSLLIARMLGYQGERDVRYGAAVELIHTATLIHDDIIDESDLRRGRPTANRRWGNQTTVLVGDWLYTRTLDMCLELGDLDVMRMLLRATVQMTEGEILADQVRGTIEVDETTYLEITRRKTAELFAAACAVPALYQPSTLHFTEDLIDYGRCLGCCFQLVDDLLDFTASRDQLGKPVMADLREGRVTLPMILLLPRLDRKRRAAIEQVVRTGEFAAISDVEVLEMVRTSGVLDEVRRRAEQMSAQAARRASRLPESAEREALVEAASLLVDRKG